MHVILPLMCNGGIGHMMHHDQSSTFNVSTLCRGADHRVIHHVRSPTTADFIHIATTLELRIGAALKVHVPLPALRL